MIENKDLGKAEILAIFKAVESLSSVSRMRVILSTYNDTFNLDEYELAAVEYLKDTEPLMTGEVSDELKASVETQTSKYFDKLSNELKEREKDIANLKEERRALKDDVQRLRDDLEKLATKPASELTELRNGLTSYEKRNANLRDLNHDLREVIESKNDEIEVIEVMTRVIENRLKSLEVENKDLTEKNRDLNDKLTASREINAKLIDKLRAIREGRTSEIVALEKHIKGYQQTVKDLQPFEDHCKIIDNRLAMAGFRFDYEQAEIIDRETGVNLRKYVEDLVTENGELKAERDQFFADRTKQNELISELEEENKELRELAKKLEEGLELYRETVSNQMNELGKQRKAAEGRASEILALEKQTKALKKKVNCLREVRKTLLGKHDKLKEDYASLQREKEFQSIDLSSRIDVEDYARLQESHNAAIGEVQKLKAVIEALRNENHQLKEHINEFNPTALQKWDLSKDQQAFLKAFGRDAKPTFVGKATKMFEENVKALAESYDMENLEPKTADEKPMNEVLAEAVPPVEIDTTASDALLAGVLNPYSDDPKLSASDEYWAFEPPRE